MEKDLQEIEGKDLRSLKKPESKHGSSKKSSKQRLDDPDATQSGVDGHSDPNIDSLAEYDNKTTKQVANLMNQANKMNKIFIPLEMADKKDPDKIYNEVEQPPINH